MCACAQVSPELSDFICQLLDKNVMKRLDIQGALQVRGAARASYGNV